MAAAAAASRAGHVVVDMAYLAASDASPEDRCVSMVASADVYVGIIGFRYGTPVPGNEGKSFTQLEFEAATVLGMPRLVFIVRDGVGILPTNQTADHDVRQEVFRRQLLAARVTVAWIASPAELELGLYQALIELESGSPRGHSHRGRHTRVR